MVYFYHGGIPDHVIKPTAVDAAGPFKDEKKSVACTSTDADRYEDEENSEEEDDVVENPGALRVTTRANIPYNTNGYRRKAMLMMNRTAEMIDRTGTNRFAELDMREAYDGMHEAYDDIHDKMIRVTQVFSNFGFEITQYENLTEDQIDQKCQDFFQRDFTDYGCVAVVLFKPDGCQIEDSVIVRHWTTNGNPTLRGKPKLYINESSHYHAYRRSHFVPYYDVPITDDHPDVLCLHIPSLFSSHVPQPLHILCDKLTTMPHDHLMAVIKETIQESKPMFRAMTYVATTQERKLFLSSSTNVENT